MSQSDLLRRSDPRKRRRSSLSSAALSGYSPPTASQSVSSSVVEGLHASVGNTLVNASISEPMGLGLAIRDDLTLGLSEVSPVDSGFSSNTAMLRVMRDASIDSSDPALKVLEHVSGGSKLPANTLRRFNAAFNYDFSHVKIHTDHSAAKASVALNAHAMALGADLFFGPGEYSPGTPQTDRLLAHELTHVMQFDRGALSSSGGVSSPSDPTEQEAYANEDFILGRLSVVDGGGLESGDSAIPEVVASKVSAVMGTDEGAGAQQLNTKQALNAQSMALGAPAFLADGVAQGPSTGQSAEVMRTEGATSAQQTTESTVTTAMSESKGESSKTSSVLEGTSASIVQAFLGSEGKMVECIDNGAHKRGPPELRLAIVDTILDSFVGSEHENAVLEVLKEAEARGEALNLIQKVGVERIDDAMDGRNHMRFRLLLKRNGVKMTSGGLS